jgi:hypothetical protein
VTKLDLMDKGTNAVDVCGFAIVMDLPSVGIALKISYLHAS